MTRWKRGYWKIIGGSTVATELPLVVTAEALAHSGDDGEDAQATAAVAADEHHTPAPEAAVSAEMPESPDAEGAVIPAAAMPMEADETPIEASSVAQESPIAVSQANLAEGFSMGLGESLPGLIIAGPFLLLTLKKQLQS
jgi:hypothetical protein